MSEILSRERVGKFGAYAGVALALAGAVKLFVQLRGGETTPSQTGGWEELNLSGAELITDYNPARLGSGGLEQADQSDRHL